MAAKRRTYLVGYDVAKTPLSENAQDELERNPKWELQHVFTGLWAVRTHLRPEWISYAFATALGGKGSGAGVIVTRLRRRGLAANGISPRQVELIQRLLPEE